MHQYPLRYNSNKFTIISAKRKFTYLPAQHICDLVLNQESVTTTSKRSGRVSVHCCEWIAHGGTRMLHHIMCHLDGFQYTHILQNVMVLSVRMLFPRGIIQFEQDHSSNHNCCVLQEWILLQADIELTDWPPRAPDMNLIENTWSEVKRTMHET
jgi:hypothetical protein